MAINSKVNREKEEVEAIEEAIQKALYEDYNYPIINCRYNQDLDQFIAYCFVDRNDDNSMVVMKFDYDEAIGRICNANVELLLRNKGA
jgi:hypothetical protein